MTAPGGAQYLPPVVTRLLGDASDLLAAFAEAKAAQEAYTKSSTDMAEKVKSSTRLAGRDVDDFTSLVVRKMQAGESATAVLKRRLHEVGDEVTSLRKRLNADSANQGLFADFKRANDELKKLRNLARDIAPELLDAGRKGGRGFVGEILAAFSSLSEIAMPLIIGAVVLALPFISALIGSAVLVGLGLGFAGIGTIAAVMLFPKIKMQAIAAGNELKKALVYAISGSFLPAVRSAFLIFRQYIPLIGKDLRRIFDALAPIMKPLADALGAGIDTFLAHLADAMPNIVPSLLEFINTIPLVMQAVADFLVKITENGPALSRFIVDAAYAISGFLNSAADVIAWLEGVYLWLAKLNEKLPFIGWANTVHGLIVTFGLLKEYVPKAWDAIVKAGKAVGDWFANLGKSIWNWLKSAGKAIGDWVTSVVRWFAALPGRVIRFVQSIPGRIIAFVSQMAHRVVYWIGWMAGMWFKTITELPGKVIAIIANVWDWTVAKTQAAIAWLIAHIQALPGQVAAFFAQLWTSVTHWVAKTWNSAVLWFTRTKASIIERIGSAITAAIAFFKGLPGRAGDELVKFKDRVTGFFKGAKDWLVEAGKDIVRGIVHGIEQMWDWAVGKVKSFAGDLVKGFKDAIGSHSPAKAFVTEGMNSALGYIQGWQRSIGRARDAMSGRRTLDVVLSYPHGGNPRPPAPPGPPGGAGGGMVQTAVYLDGKRFATAITPASQKRGQRNGITGTGLPTTRLI